MPATQSPPRPQRRTRTPPDTPCLACKCPVHKRPRRGLCRRCWAKPAVRLRFACKGSKLGTQGRDDRDFHGPAPPPPPDFSLRPGPAKLPALADRAARGLSLFHRREPSLRLDAAAVARILRGETRP